MFTHMIVIVVAVIASVGYSVVMTSDGVLPTICRCNAVVVLSVLVD